MHVVVFIALASIAGLFDTANFYTELCSHFYAQYFAVLSLYLLCLIVLKQWKFSLLMTPFIATCLVKIAPLYIPRLHTESSNAPPIRILTINVNAGNRDATQQNVKLSA